MIIITIIKSYANPGRVFLALLLKGDAYSREGAYFILNKNHEKPKLQSFNSNLNGTITKLQLKQIYGECFVEWDVREVCK